MKTFWELIISMPSSIRILSRWVRIRRQIGRMVKNWSRWIDVFAFGAQAKHVADLRMHEQNGIFAPYARRTTGDVEAIGRHGSRVILFLRAGGMPPRNLNHAKLCNSTSNYSFHCASRFGQIRSWNLDLRGHLFCPTVQLRVLTTQYRTRKTVI